MKDSGVYAGVSLSRNSTPTDAYLKRVATLFEAQGGICARCGMGMNDPTIDHVWPRKYGGFAGWGNIVLMHSSCNHAKAAALPNGCQIIWLTSVCEALSLPLKMKAALPWKITPTIKTILTHA